MSLVTHFSQWWDGIGLLGAEKNTNQYCVIFPVNLSQGTLVGIMEADTNTVLNLQHNVSSSP